MKWIDYREKLGIGINDTAKESMFRNKISISLRQLSSAVSNNTLIYQWERALEDFYYCIGSDDVYFDDQHLVQSITCVDGTNSILSRYIAFANSFCKYLHDENFHELVWNMLYKALFDLNIPYEIFDDHDGKFIFPKGAKELDDALISEPLDWLVNYPTAHKTFVIALKQYSEGVYIRDVADNLRKALEAFLQEFLGNRKNLESNKADICKYLGENGVDAGISGLYQPLINSYKNINDRIAKHNDAVDKKLLEFLLYQTGLLIRMIISIKMEVEKDAD